MRQLLATGKGSPEMRRRAEEMLRSQDAVEAGESDVMDTPRGPVYSSPAIVDASDDQIRIEPGESGPGGMSGGGGGAAPGAPGGGMADPYARFREPAGPITGMPAEEAHSPAASRADAVLGYLRSGLHGLDRSVTFGAGTALGEMVDPGTRARGEQAARDYPVGEALGMLGGALIPSGMASRVGQGAMKAAGGIIQGGKTLAKVGRGALAGALGGAGQELAEDVVAGRPVEGVDRAAAVSGLVGGGLAALGAGASGIQKWVRDPDQQLGRDIASAEKIGAKTAAVRGVTPGPVFERADAAARAESAAGKPRSPAGIAEEAAAPVLGRAVQGDINQRLGAMQAENAGLPEEMVSLQPMVDKAMGSLRRMMRDQRPLPGMNARSLAKHVRDSSNIELVDVTDPMVERAAAENVMMADEAAAMGLIQRSGDLQNKAVIISPRWVNQRELEDIRRTFDAGGKVTPQSPRAAGEVKVARGMAGAAREARSQLGPEAADRAARHEQSMENMENVINAAGLPPGTRNVDPGDLATRRQLAGAVRGYRTRANEGAGVDAVLDQLAGQGPLRGALDDAAGVAAISRLRREAEVPVTGGGSLGTYGLKDAAKLRADAVMRYLEAGVGATARPVGRGVVPAVGAMAAPRRERR